MRLIMGLVDLVLNLFSLCLWIYVILSWIRPASNRWTELLRSIVEPVLTPIRNFLRQHLPGQLQMFDWSPIACWLMISLLCQLLSPLRYF